MPTPTEQPINCCISVFTMDGQISAERLARSLESLTMWIKEAGADVELSSGAVEEPNNGGRIYIRAKIGGSHAEAS